VLHLPDIIGTIEIFELSGLQALADEIEAISGVHYEAHLIEARWNQRRCRSGRWFPGQDSRAFRSTALFRKSLPVATARLRPATRSSIRTGNPALLNDRPPLVLRATVDAATPNPRQNHRRVNHLRSFIDIELLTGDGPRVRAEAQSAG
jgi:hypothetical protein